MRNPVLFFLVFVTFTQASDFVIDEPNLKMQENVDYKQVYLFQKRHKNYLVFYSSTGSIIYIKFQKDLFDYRNISYLKILRPGQPFRVTYTFLKVDTQLPVKDENSSEFEFLQNNENEIEIRKPGKIYIGKLVKLEYYIDHLIRY